MRSMANTFCGEAMGEVMPPRLEAKATPSTRARARAVPGGEAGSVRRTGANKE